MSRDDDIIARESGTAEPDATAYCAGCGVKLVGEPARCRECDDPFCQRCIIDDICGPCERDLYGADDEDEDESDG